ncbi:MAG: hypothetical protein UY40_C0007G0012 [candidate division CPR1 bacterium GW2011_GWC1_49_13]|uniref:Uncharacterized protein n=1 Tax=candidate division CPR1 bacterium GW2011_GWC1_49_13 TaxID=1618342 RepID=A0A0G1VH44_9BACT|nr:MAG: hypothetical protein UY40_C0007G0012 [candidate division CPR1 bacterium GW2011_GWC1_49_13]
MSEIFVLILVGVLFYFGYPIGKRLWFRLLYGFNPAKKRKEAQKKFGEKL